MPVWTGYAGDTTAIRNDPHVTLPSTVRALAKSADLSLVGSWALITGPSWDPGIQRKDRALDPNPSSSVSPSIKWRDLSRWSLSSWEKKINPFTTFLHVDGGRDGRERQSFTGGNDLRNTLPPPCRAELSLQHHEPWKVPQALVGFDLKTKESWIQLPIADIWENKC